MAEILRESRRLFLRRAEPEDIDYICALQEAEDNRDYIVPFSRADHETIILQGKAALDLIVVEKEPLVRVGYLHVGGLLLESKEQEWTHVVVEKKGCGYGHETMQLLKAWAFDVCGAHRARTTTRARCTSTSPRAWCARRSSVRHCSTRAFTKTSSSSASSTASIAHANVRVLN